MRVIPGTVTEEPAKWHQVYNQTQTRRLPPCIPGTFLVYDENKGETITIHPGHVAVVYWEKPA